MHSLYERLGVAVEEAGDVRGETNQSFGLPTETIDEARLPTLYQRFGTEVSDATDPSRTEQTREAPETIDNDRVVHRVAASLVAPRTDLYVALGTRTGTRSAAGEETALTASTETIDLDRPAVAHRLR